MSYLNLSSGYVVSELPGEAKAGFMRRIYGPLAVAIAAIEMLDAPLISMGCGEKPMAILATRQLSFLLVTEVCQGVGVLAA